jgi:hypothetical protein
MLCEQMQPHDNVIYIKGKGQANGWNIVRFYEEFGVAYGISHFTFKCDILCSTPFTIFVMDKGTLISREMLVLFG